MNARERRRGFTLLELGVGVALVGVGAGLLAPALEKSRQEAKQVVDLSNMRMLGQAASAYAAEYDGILPSYSGHRGSELWRPDDVSEILVNQLADVEHDGDAAALQATDIIWRRGGRSDIPAPKDWLPHPMYSPLILQDYLASRLPEAIVISPGDSVRAEWQDFASEISGDDILAGNVVPAGLVDTPENRMLLYSSSYQTVPATYDVGQSVWGKARNSAPLAQRAGTHRDYVVSSKTRLRQQQWSQVVFPAQKVFMHADRDYYSEDQPLYWADPRATVPVAFFDGAVALQQTSSLNPGWDPTKPHEDGATTITFAPAPWEVQAEPEGELLGRMRWTRGGLRGLDVGGQEIRTSKPAEQP